MVGQGVHPNTGTFGILIYVLSKIGNISFLFFYFLVVMIKKGESSDLFTYSTMMHGFCLVVRLDEAKELFISVSSKGCKLDANFTVLINGYCKKLRITEALNLYREMIYKGVKPSVVIYSALLTGLFQAGKVEVVHILFREMQVRDLAPDSIMYANINGWALQEQLYYRSIIMINGLCREGELEKANDLFSEIERKSCAPDVATYNTLMRGFCQCCLFDKVVQRLKMAKRKLQSDLGTLSFEIELLSKDEKCRE